uniref:RING-type E3 ubiquitin transferase n=1 Tax=Setaria digitata TaxID=48799 RepID=A0A915PR40_9BILA
MGQIASLRRRANVPNVTSGTDNDDENCEMHRFSSHPGAFFGSYFLLGGERYDLAKPEAFLFGDNADLDILGNRSVQFPYSSQPVNDPVRTLNALINLRRDSLKLTKSKNDCSESNKNSFCLEFYFDCDSACYVQIHFFAKEFVSDGRIQFMHKYPQLKSSEQYYFDVGAEQHFNKFIMDTAVYDLSSMHYESGSYFPVVIEIRAVDCGIEQMQSTMASIEHATDQCATFVVKALKQKLVADGVVYLLQEIYGIENKEHDLGDENGSECIICMSDIRDTVILPCRHLCICNGCAETLRYKLNNCPICRSPFRALLQLKTMRVVSTVSITDQSPSSQQTRSQTRYETMTLVEALNGPISHIQSCVVPAAPIGYNIDSPHEAVTPLNSKITRRSSRSSVAIQQVLTLNNQGRNKKEDNTVCIEMKSANEFKNEEEVLNGCSTSRCVDSSEYSPVLSHGRRCKKLHTVLPQYERKESIESVAQENTPTELTKNSNDIATIKDTQS